MSLPLLKRPPSERQVKVMKKRLVALMLTVICILIFSGCSTGGASLFSALQKATQITSVKTTEALSAEMNITLPQEIKDEMDPFYLQSLLNMLSSFRIEGTTRQQTNGNTAVEKANLSLISEDLYFDTELYASVSEDGAKTIVKIPTPAKAILPERYADAVYFTIDTNDNETFMKKQQELNRLQAEYFGYDYTESEVPRAIHTNNITAAKALNESFFNFLKEYGTLMSDAPEMVTKTNHTYSVLLTDETFKDLLHSVVKTYFEKPQAREAASDLTDAFRTFYLSMYPDDVVEEMMLTLPALPEDNPALLVNLQAQTELMVNMLKPVRLIGDEGIRINYKLNSTGYITEMDAKIHLDIDINALTELLEGEIHYEEDFAFDLKLHYNQKRQNINGTQKISLPTLTETNNLSFYRMLADSMQEEINYYQSEIENENLFPEELEQELNLPAPDGSISVVIDHSGWLELAEFGEATPFIHAEGTLYVPMEPMLDYMGMSYDRNPKTGYALFTNPYNNNWMWFRPGDRVICCDDYELTLSAPTLNQNGQIYLPLRAFTSAFSDWKIRWSAKENAAYLVPWYSWN